MSNVTVQEALKATIEALKGYRRELNDNQPCDAEKLGEAALADIEKCEPVAWMDETNRTCNALSKKCSIGFADGLFDTYNIPLYTSPQPRDWVGVDDAISVIELYAPNHEIIAKLKQLNMKG